MERLQYLLVIALLGVAASGKSFAENSTMIPHSTVVTESKTPVAAIVAPCVIGGVLLIGIILTVGIIKLKGKRREEGTYNPSHQEQIGAQTQINHGLKLPPEERLI